VNVEAGSRRGIVYIAWADLDDEPGFYFGYWDGLGRNTTGEGFIAQMPETPSTREALDWAHARSERIIVRPRWDPTQHYSAGDLEYAPLPPLPGDRIDE
jgi:hypothetical protein